MRIRRCATNVTLFLASSLSFAVSAAGKDAAKPSSAGIAFFETKIRPVLVEKCYSCHSGESDELKAGLHLDSRQGVLTGGYSGPAIVPGNPADSLIIQAIRYEGYEMPP